MAELNAKEFLEVVKKSGLVDESKLKTALAELSKIAAGQPVKTPQLADHLIASGLITAWHREKLEAGKYKGYWLAQYKLLGHLGSGGMSSVYLAEHVLSGHRRAIKVLPKHRVSDKSYLDRFYLEGRAAAALNHPHIVRIYDLANVDDTHFMVMEYVEGIDLQQLVKQQGPLAYDRALNYIQQAAEGLEHAHGRNLVHRDIKPANLLLNKEGVIKILDLGLALMRDDQESLTLLYNETVMGTADYLSPEQAVNSHAVDHRADFYSLGGTLYFLLAGHPPFPKGTIAQRIAMHQTQSPQPLAVERPDCPAAIQQLIDQLMSKKPEQRFATAKDLIRALKRLRFGMQAANPTPSSVPAVLDVAKSPDAPAVQEAQRVSNPGLAGPVVKANASMPVVQSSAAAGPSAEVAWQNQVVTVGKTGLQDLAKSVTSESVGLSGAGAGSARRKRKQKSYTVLYVLIAVMFFVLLGILIAVLTWMT